jgi:1-acyl-sn-glycerol-3-phosphate acyltransferase
VRDDYDEPLTTDQADTAEDSPNLLEQVAREASSLLPAVLDADTSADERLQDVDHWGRSERARQRARQIYDFMYRVWFRTEMKGLENIPKSGGALLVANHAGAVPSDAPVIMHGVEAGTGRPLYGMAEHLFKTLPVVGTAWARFGGVSAHPENAHRLLQTEGQLALVFPEGVKGPGKPFSQRYRLARFGRGGFVETAMRAGVPVIPIAVVGSEEAMPNLVTIPWLAKITGMPFAPVTPFFPALGLLGLALPLPVKMRVHILPPVDFPDKPNMPRYSRARVMEYSDLIRDMIQTELYEMLAARKSVFFG